MGVLINSIYIFILMFTKTNDVHLIAVTDAPDVLIHRIYGDERNEDRPYHWDPATIDESARLRVCEDTTKVSGSFAYELANMNEISESTSSDIFPHLREHRQSSNSPNSDNYTTPYRLRKLEIITLTVDNHSRLRSVSQIIKEYVLVCSLKRRKLRDIIPYYVSKAYNPLYTRRFVFPIPQSYLSYTPLKLVERSAEAYTKQDFSVELHYLQLRKYHQPVRNVDADPVCKLSSGNMHENQTFRLCNIILTSSYFKATVSSPLQIHSGGCKRRIILFRPAEGTEESTQTPYQELLLRCYAQRINPEDSPVFYVSRAYNPNEVFVYDNTFRLQVLLTYVGIVHERYNFGNVEI